MPDLAPEQPMLIIRHDENPDIEIAIESDSITIGRGEECDVTLEERKISRQHVRIFKDKDGYSIEDLESKNGTWVNGQQIKGTRRLYDGDEIQMALVIHMQFIGSGSTAPLTHEIPAVLSSRLRLDPSTRRVFIGTREVDPPLSPPQYRLIELLYMSSGRICTRDEVVSTVWPDVISDGVSEQAIDALVRRLRDRLIEYEPNWNYIVTVRGHGFRLENPDIS